MPGICLDRQNPVRTGTLYEAGRDRLVTGP